MNRKIKKITVISTLCAVAYIMTFIGRIPIILFLKYDPKDIIITISGFIFGPSASFLVSFVVSMIEMFTISENGLLGFIMNMISSCSFACIAAIIYRKKRNMHSVIIGMLCGLICQVTIMMLWNYLVAPIYMGYPRESVVKLLLPAFLPFNLIKGSLNAAATILIYRPAMTALQRSHLLKTEPVEKSSHMKLILSVTCIIIIICVLFILFFNDAF